MKTIAIAILLLSASVFGAATVGGFADAQFQTLNSQTTNNSFTIYDGAVHLSLTGGDTKAMVKLPFASFDDPKTPRSSSFLVGFDRAQAFVNHKYSSGLWWQMGQFDSIFGFESNATKDNYISRQGILFAGKRVTHLGLMTGYALTPKVSAKVLVSNPNNSASRNGAALEFGGQVTYSGDFHVTAGYLHWQGNQRTMLADVIAGTKFGALTVDVESMLVTPDIAGASTGLGVGVFVSHEFATNSKINLRGEFANNFSSVVGNPVATQLGVAVGPSHKFSDQLTGRFDYTLRNSKATATTTTATTTHQIVISTVMVL